ncbi:hypothetical protein KM043_015525 [Ampulex compressa]|nr:hypothetical protein KM043_015525 [Ampulex compressa]
MPPEVYLTHETTIGIPSGEESDTLVIRFDVKTPTASARDIANLRSHRNPGRKFLIYVTIIIRARTPPTAQGSNIFYGVTKFQPKYTVALLYPGVRKTGKKKEFYSCR